MNLRVFAFLQDSQSNQEIIRRAHFHW